MASDRRSSISSLRSAISRTSMTSQRPPTPQSSERRPPSPLTQKPGVPTLSPPNIVGKDRLPPPMTPQRKPVQRQKSPLSAEAFSSPSAMPGSFPEDAASPTPAPETPDSTSRSTKRLSSMTKLLPFKGLRKSIDNNASPHSPTTSSDADPYRPKTPGGESTNSPTAASSPSLRKRVSGTFWRRKSSLSGPQFTPGGGSGGENNTNNNNSDDPTSSPRPINGGIEAPSTIRESSRPSSPSLPESTTPSNANTNSPLVAKKRKSGTFWRRTSSLTLTQTLTAERQGWGGGGRRPSGELLNGHGPSPSNNNSNSNNTPGRIDEEDAPPSQSQPYTSGQGKGPPFLPSLRKSEDLNLSKAAVERKVSDRKKPLPPTPTLGLNNMPPRKRSPPPQIPPFLGAGSGLGLGEDWLRGFG